MVQVKTKKKRKRRAAPGYRKPRAAVGCKAFGGKTYTEAKLNLLTIFHTRFVSALATEHGGNLSAMARAADMERVAIRRILRQLDKMAKRRSRA
jgi:hypothetical protein